MKTFILELFVSQVSRVERVPLKCAGHLWTDGSRTDFLLRQAHDQHLLAIGSRCGIGILANGHTFIILVTVLIGAVSIT